MLVGKFEEHFRDFVRRIGGTVLPESDDESADFLFPTDNIVTELKTLQEDARSEYERKLQALAEGWMKRGLLIAFGRVQISLQQPETQVCHFDFPFDSCCKAGFPFGRILEPPCVNAQRRYRRLVEMPFGTPSLDAKLLSIGLLLLLSQRDKYCRLLAEPIQLPKRLSFYSLPPAASFAGVAN